MLDARNLKTSRPSKSLDHKNIGPYKIVRVINNMAYEIALPETLKGVHPVFHPWLLYLDDDNPLPGQYEPPPPPVNVDEEGEDHEAEEILDSRIDKRRNDPLTGKKGCLVYKVKYKGYEGVWIWQPFTDIAGCLDLVADYHHKYADKPGPHQSFTILYDWEPLLALLLFDNGCGIKRPSSIQDTESIEDILLF